MSSSNDATISEVLCGLGTHQKLSGGLVVWTDTGSMPAAVLGELCLVQKCVPEVSLEKRAAGVPLGMQEGEGIEECSGFMSQSGKLQECLSRLE